MSLNIRLGAKVTIEFEINKSYEKKKKNMNVFVAICMDLKEC